MAKEIKKDMSAPGTAPMSLKDYAKSLVTLSLPIMEGRTKKDLEKIVGTGEVITIRDYDFMTITKKGEEETFVVFIVDEYPDEWMFGGMVLTDQLSKMDANGFHDVIVSDGLPVLLSIRKSEGGKKYTAVDFYPGV